MRRTLSVLAVLLGMTACPPLYAQDTVVGRVVDQDHHPIGHTTVQSADILHSVQTDDSGAFTINLTKPRPVSVTFSHAGYIPKSVRIGSGDKSMTVSLVEQVYPMEGITVTSGRAIDRKSPVSFQTVDRKTIERDFDIGEAPISLR